MTEPQQTLTYKAAGVDIDAGAELVERIKPAVARTRRAEVLGGLGGFGALFELPMEHYQKPVLVGATDGVGTKLKLALMLNRHDTVGIDLVAMCVNDLVVQGAEPLFFLDYYATGHLSLETATAVVSGIAEGCVQAGAALVGGETAEMPGLYQGEDYDLAGFCVGVVEKEAILDGRRAQPGDTLIALGSTGPHSNGYSLIRRILEHSGADTNAALPGDVQRRSLGEALLAPTRIYVRTILSLLPDFDLRAIAHVTGGGLPENLPRVLPQGTRAVIHGDSWQWPPVFQWLQAQGNVSDSEMLRTFNCGVGMVLCVPEAQSETLLIQLAGLGEQAWILGRIEAGEGAAEVIFQ